MACRKDETKASCVTVWESERLIHIDGCYDVRSMTPWQARYLARQLHRLARRINARAALKGDE